MSLENSEKDLCLPLAPQGICFDRLEFVKNDFSVDGFLAAHSDGVSLETMRDDLGAYLKVLRLAMIELINRDYANFVNLSATLVGFDKAVDKIQQPLTQLKEEVISVNQCLEDAMRELSIWRNQETLLRQKKLTLKYYSQTLSSFKALENILQVIETCKDSEIISLIDRAVLHYNQLQFTLSKCGSLIKDEKKTQYFKIGDILNDKLNNLLLTHWRGADEDEMLRVLLTLSSLNKVSETEDFLKEKAVAPYLHDIIAESNLQKDAKGLKGIYEKILHLLDDELKLIVNIMKHPKLTVLINKYNFIVNCFWKEVESRLEVNLGSIFAPGNPNTFYCRYSESMEFLKRLEEYCGDRESVDMLRATAEYKNFQKRWNLPVYYQIRFQEIAGDLESNLSSPSLQSQDWRLSESACLWTCMHRCWSDGVYVRALTHKFWKLTLQLLARFTVWIESVCLNKPKHQEVTIDEKLIKRSIYIYLDVQRLLHNMPNFLQTVKQKIDNDNLKMLDDSLKLSADSLKGTIPKIQKCIVNELYEYFVIQLRQVSEIPRLYRKTNRSVPTKPCAYIEVVSNTVKEFINQYKDLVGATFFNDLLRELFTRTTELYCTSVVEVLTSVQKTEESLRRLKQIREGTPQTESSGVSDGDKIRLQLKVDVSAYREMVTVDVGSKLNELEKLMLNAVKNIDVK